MTQDALKKLELNLTKSDSKARKGYVRCKVGLLPEDQGFAPVEALPIFNFIQNKETTLAEFIEDTKILSDKHFKLLTDYNLTQAEYDIFKKATIKKEIELQLAIDELNKVDLQELRIVMTSLSNRVQKLEDETDII